MVQKIIKCFSNVTKQQILHMDLYSLHSMLTMWGIVEHAKCSIKNKKKLETKGLGTKSNHKYSLDSLSGCMKTQVNQDEG